MGLNQDRGHRRLAAGRGRSRGRHARGLAVAGEPAASRPCWPGHEPSWPDSLLASARQFITLFYSENQLGQPDRRLWHVRHEIEERGTYWHTPRELAFGARVAWRNSPQGTGQRYWRTLRVRDRREITSASGIAAQAAAHLHEATNGGQVRPVITVFAPDAPGRPGPRIPNSQLIGYAGNQGAGGPHIMCLDIGGVHYPATLFNDCRLGAGIRLPLASHQQGCLLEIN